MADGQAVQQTRQPLPAEHSTGGTCRYLTDLLKWGHFVPRRVRSLLTGGQEVDRQQSLEQRPQDLITLGKVVVERGPRDAGGSGNVFNSYCVVPAVDKQLQGTVHDRFPRRQSPVPTHKAHHSRHLSSGPTAEKPRSASRGKGGPAPRAARRRSEDHPKAARVRVGRSACPSGRQP